jgi:hypothetical protein
MRRIIHDRVIHVPIYGDLKLKPLRQPALSVNTGTTLTPTLSLGEGEGAVRSPRPRRGRRQGEGGAQDAEHAFVNGAG